MEVSSGIKAWCVGSAPVIINFEDIISQKSEKIESIPQYQNMIPPIPWDIIIIVADETLHN